MRTRAWEVFAAAGATSTLLSTADADEAPPSAAGTGEPLHVALLAIR